MRTKSRVATWAVATGSVVALSATLMVTSADAGDEATLKAIEKVRVQDDAPGAGAFIRTGDDVRSVSTGTRIVGKKLPFGADEKMRIGSMTKTFTAAIVLQLVDEKKVDLDTSVETYIPGVVQGNGYDGNKITVRQLLNMTSGVAEYLTPEVLLNPVNQVKTHTLAEVASWGLAQKPTFQPGEGQSYSDTNFILAGMIIESVTGRTYEQELRSRIIEPLGLADTYLPEPGDKVLPPEHVRGYVHKTAAGRSFFVDTTDLLEPSMGLSGGGMVSTGRDLTRFFQALLTGEVIPQELLEEMKKPNGAPDPALPDYGLGIDRFELPCGGDSYGHYGRWPGYVVYTAATDDGRSAAVVVNTFDTLAAVSGGAGSGEGNADVRPAVTTALCEAR